MSARGTSSPLEVTGLSLRRVRVPLVEPFVISSGTLLETDAVEVCLSVRDADRVVHGRGECATLPPVTHETPSEVEAALAVQPWVRARLRDAIDGLSDGPVAELGPVARAGLETAWLDALGQLRGRSVAALLAQGEAGPIALAHESDITLPIAAPQRMGELARAWTQKGFGALKIKVGRAHEDDVAALAAVIVAAPTARLRLDANAALSARDALRLLEAVRALGGHVELYEQPCRADDLAGMAEVVRLGEVPVVADESCQGLEDVARLADARAATGVNLKLVKNGGPLASLAIGLAARAQGMSLMAGAMVETRLGLAAMMHVVAALGGVEYVDLDTALLLASDPYEGGYDEALPTLTLRADATGLGVRPRVGQLAASPGGRPPHRP